MKPKWLIEHFDDRNSTQLLIEEVKRQGYEFEAIHYEPFQSGNYNVFNKNDCVIVQSSINFAQQMMREKPDWIPGVWLTEINYRCQSYYAHLGEYLFNDRYIMMPRNDVRRSLKYLHDYVGKEKHLFIRPDSALKPFTAKVFRLENFDIDWTWVEEFTNPESLIVISSPKKIIGEWRFIVVDKKVITGCQYEYNGELNITSGYSEGAKKLADKVAETYQPDPVFVIDICQGVDEEFYLLELGAFSVAGLYACDMKAIVETVSEFALKEWQDINFTKD